MPIRFGTPMRAMSGVVALGMAFAAAVLVLTGGTTEYLMAAGAVFLAGMMGYVALTGREPFLYSPSRRFAELADPSRPLTDEDFRLPPDHEAARTDDHDALPPP
ncbi:MAG TPA: hypothetical protein VF771_08280 [Longimicrobiaceae bacterium]